MKMRLTTLLAMLLSFDAFTSNAQVMHFDRPADYLEEAVVIGNGTQGAIIYGGTESERISLNDITLWTGEPETEVFAPDAFKAIPRIRELIEAGKLEEAHREQRRVQGHYSENYQPLGWLQIDYEHGQADTAVHHYSRTLDLATAVAATGYMAGRMPVNRQYIASAVDSVIVIRLTAMGGQGITAKLSFNSLLPHTVEAGRGSICAQGYAAYHSFPGYYNPVPDEEKHQYDPQRGTRFCAIVSVKNADGTLQELDGGEIGIADCHDATIYIAIATSFNGADRNPATQGRPCKRLAEGRICRLHGVDFEQLKDRHISDYSSLYGRVSIDLGQTPDSVAVLPTDVQLRRYTALNEANPDLEELYFQFGRYLLISCSRTPGVPANLQGLWNEKLLPPWSSNYTLNINAEENYWAAETTNLSELHRPFLSFLQHLQMTGTATARAYYGVENGWCCGHNSDIWAMSNPVGMGEGDPMWANWNMGGAWAASHIWEHYLFTCDIDFLQEYYPVLKGAAEFCLGWMIERNGELITSPSTSPENTYLTPDGFVGSTLAGGTADLAIARQCISDAAAAAKVLGGDKDFAARARRTLKKMHPYRVGSNGNLQEWYEDWADSDPHHRHQSHLYGLFPGRHITVRTTPLLAEACARSLEIKGDESTGWSTGWRVNLFARLHDADGAYHLYRKLLRYVSPDDYRGDDAVRGGGTYPNLLDAHSPFQIDGNFGGCSGVAEMLLQSDEQGNVQLLPALPAAWMNGKADGLCARGGLVLNFSWENGTVASLTVMARARTAATLHVNGKEYKVRLAQGETRKVI